MKSLIKCWSQNLAGASQFKQTTTFGELRSKVLPETIYNDVFVRYGMKVVSKPRRNSLVLGGDRSVHELPSPAVNKFQKDDEEGVAEANAS